MKQESRRKFCVAIYVLFAFLLWTIAVCFVDVQAIGPQESSVGFATMNHFVHKLTGLHLSLYTVTDWLGLAPLAFIMGFAILGLTQWIRRKHLLKVDFSILVLGGFYLLVFALYVLFEVLIINYRPVLIDGVLEVSYPSSTTMLTLCVMPTAIMQFRERVKSAVVKGCLSFAMTAFAVLVVIARFLSGVHWTSDIIGGMLLSAGLVLLYRAVRHLQVH